MISPSMPPQAAFYQPSQNVTGRNSFPGIPDNFRQSPAAIKEKAIVDAGRNQAALNYLNLQVIIGKRLQQLAQAPLTVATLPMGEFKQLSEAIGPGGHPHHPPFPPPFGFPPPPPPSDFRSTALQPASMGPPQAGENPPNQQNRLSMFA